MQILQVKRLINRQIIIDAIHLLVSHLIQGFMWLLSHVDKRFLLSIVDGYFQGASMLQYDET